MGNCHHHHVNLLETEERQIWWAISANMLLTFTQVVGGLFSGSLSLVADALHNFSDAASLWIAVIAIRIGKKPPDQFKTFGYKRAETVAALINLTTLVIIGLYLVVEACKRFYSPEPIEGWTVIIVAGIALVVDIFTALITYKKSKHSMNMKAAFLHNITDAFASLAVIISGILILLYGWTWTDAFMTLLISIYVLWQGFTEIPKIIHLLMEGAPKGIDLNEIICEMEKQDGVKNVHHLHVWQLDEHRNALEAHVVLNKDVQDMDNVKFTLKHVLQNEFKIEHSTLEFENKHCVAKCPCI